VTLKLLEFYRKRDFIRHRRADKYREARENACILSEKKKNGNRRRLIIPKRIGDIVYRNAPAKTDSSRILFLSIKLSKRSTWPVRTVLSGRRCSIVS